MKKYIILSVFVLCVGVLTGPVFGVHAAEEIDAYCVVPEKAVPHGSSVSLTIQFSDTDKSNDFIVQGPFKILKYKDGTPIIVDFKRGNEKDADGKENPEKPTLTFSVTLSPKHKLPAPATEAVTSTYYVTHKEGKRGKLYTTSREQTVECSFTVQHESENIEIEKIGLDLKSETPNKNIVPADLGIEHPGMLPTSPFYFFKEWGRGIERFFTFNSIKKAELELRITNEKAVEAFAVQQAKPNDAKALARALENYTKAQERLQTRIAGLSGRVDKETSENPNVGKLLKKLDEQTLKHANLLNQLTERYIGDPDFDLITKAIKDAQGKIQGTVVSAAEKDKNIGEKAAEQIKRAGNMIFKLEFELETFAINEPGVPNDKLAIKTKGTGAQKALVETAIANAKAHLARAQAAFAEGKFGEAFGEARSAEVGAWHGLRMFTDKNGDGTIRKDEMKNTLPPSAGMPIVPGTDTSGKLSPEPEMRVFPETNNRTACDDRDTPACPAGKILECHQGKWVCIGPASGGEMPIVPSTDAGGTLLPEPEMRVFPETNNQMD
ncbi:hypothetical protein HYR65_02655, partial [Candidatus Azambacteria bacterium]|nr:hypothetical protein [Candidatus Azambacteria bacterium]